MLTPAERAQRARIAAHAMHAKHDPVETTQKARDAFLERFLDEVDPDGELRRTNPAEARRRAASERKRFFAQLAFRSMKARSKKNADQGINPVGVEQEGHHHGSPAEF